MISAAAITGSVVPHWTNDHGVSRAGPPLVPLIRVELHSLGLGVSVSPLVALVSV